MLHSPVIARSGWQAPARPTPDHLALVRALLENGQTGRALELLDAVWHPAAPEEHTAYLRLWILSAQGRVLEALELAAELSGRLPGSAAVAWLQAVLERLHGSPAAALEALDRVMALAAGRPEVQRLTAMLEPESPGPRPDAGSESHPGFVGSPFAPTGNLYGAALAGASLLLPFGSPRPWRPLRPAAEPLTGEVARPRPDRRLWVVALGVAVAAVWAVRDPMPAAVALAGLVLWLGRRPPR